MRDELRSSRPRIIARPQLGECGRELAGVERVIGYADTTVVFARRDPDSPRRAGRTTTLLDDWLTRAVGALPINAALLLAGAVYGGLGLALPLLVHARVPLLIVCNVMGASLGWAITLAWIFPASEARLRRQLLEQTTNLRLLSAAEFELLIGELLRREGWDVEEAGKHGEPDGNVDLRIRRGDRHMLVQCKRWHSWQVNVDEVRKLAGTLLREGLPGTSGMLVTTSTFTPAAIAEAKQNGVELVEATTCFADSRLPAPTSFSHALTRYGAHTPARPALPR